MDAAEYLRERERLCYEFGEVCEGCPLGRRMNSCATFEKTHPEEAVEIVKRWAMEHPHEPGIHLTNIERHFARIYIDKGFLWAARDKDGELNLYRKEPKRGGDVFKNTSPTSGSCRTALPHMMPGITWENSPVCLPKLLEKEK